jgi:hypothetical protein
MKQTRSSLKTWILGAGLMAACGPVGEEPEAPMEPNALRTQQSELAPEVSVIEDDSITLTADNAYEVYVNGVLAGSQPDLGMQGWPTAETWSARFTGSDIIAVKVTNTGGVNGLLAQFKSQGRAALTTDRLWKCTAVYESGWEQPGHPDGAWPQATEYGANGVAPWGFISGIDSGVKWIGTANAYADVIYCRAVVRGCGPDEARNRPATTNNTSPAQYAFDGDLATRWVGRDGDSLTVDLGQPAVVGRAGLVWGYDTATGTSAEVDLLYSFDNVNWKYAVTQTVQAADSGSLQWRPLPRVSARYWRLVAKRFNGGTGFVQDWQLFYPCSQCDRDMAYKRPSSSNGHWASFTHDKAFDHDDTTYWGSNQSTGAELEVDLGQPMGIEKARVKWGWDINYGSSASVVLECRTRPTDPWSYLWTLSHTTASSGTPQTVSFPRTDCRYVRLRATQWNWGWGYVSDFQVLGACEPCTSLTTNRSATATSQVGTLGPHLAVDGSLGTAWESAGSTGSYMTVDLGSCKYFGHANISWGLSSCAGADAQSRLLGSNDGYNFTPLATLTQRVREHHFRQSFYRQPTECYRYLRLQAQDWQSCTGGVSELQVCDSVDHPNR